MTAIDLGYWSMADHDRVSNAAATFTLPKRGKWVPKVTVTWDREQGYSSAVANPPKGTTQAEAIAQIADDLRFLRDFAFGFSLTDMFGDCNARIEGDGGGDSYSIAIEPIDAASAGFTSARVGIKGDAVMSIDLVTADGDQTMTFTTESVDDLRRVTKVVISTPKQSPVTVVLEHKSTRSYTAVTNITRGKETLKPTWRVKLGGD
jgi:hypothetical protein